MSTRVRDRGATISRRSGRPPAQPAAVARAHRTRHSRAARRRARHAPSDASTRRRLIGISVAIALVFGLIGARLIDVQARNRRHYQQLGIDQRVHLVTLVPERGTIFDRNGNDLAVSVARSTVWADPRHIKNPDAYAAALAPIVGEDVNALANTLGQKDRSFVYVGRKLERDAVARVKALDLPGLGVIPETKRYYPADSLAAPLLGFVGIDNNGLAGLEAGADVTLAGKSGKMEVEQDPKGRELPEGEREIVAPERGADLVLTIDQSLQYEVERVLAEEVEAVAAKGGTAVLADTRTGDVLAMATVTGATSTVPAHAASAAEPNRPLTDVFEPGSTNKVVTIAAALEAGVVSPDTVLQVPGRIVVDGQEYKDVASHPTSMSVADIVRESSNVGTIEIAKMLGAERFDAALRSFGFGTGTGLGFPGEAEGILLPLDQYNSTSLASMPIGSGIAVTAMQMLDVYLTIANGGVARAPRLVSATVDADGNRQELPLGATRRVVSETTAAQMSAMLEAVVAGGTGTNAQIAGYRVAGKTGTARKPPYVKPPYKYVTSFAGFAPANDPHLAAIVVLDEPQKGSISGGQLAAPVFAHLMQYALAVGRVPASS